MNIKEIKDLLQLIESSNIEEFELERSGVRLRIRKSSQHLSPPHASERQKPALALATQAPGAATPETEKKEELHTFRAPLVGTFYLTPKPDAEPFVRISDQVKKGSVLCIIEAMKLFNQIESDVDGEIVRILVENGQPVEYGEPLFEIRIK
ncbi:MAG: acetyl-CoA carboxylase biotin carboxyl carrier protein [Acidobacteria bacterium]|nr:acetyl-CoA carboxylase biotin carboxyl carrier protein [Acidobacteriota bacterium]